MVVVVEVLIASMIEDGSQLDMRVIRATTDLNQSQLDRQICRILDCTKTDRVRQRRLTITMIR